MSEPTPIDLPVGLRWVKLVCRLGTLVTDSAADADAHPDLLPVGGTLTLTASPSRVRIQEDDGRWRSVEVAGRTYTIRADGELVDGEGRVGVYIPDPASTLIEPQGYAITAAVKPTGGTEWRVTVGGSDVLPDVVDLVAVSSVGTASPSVTASFDARLYALEQGGGGGADVSDATTTTKGILRLAGDLGGTATAPTVPGLAGKADTGHDHAIGDVTGLQTALDGKQASGSYAAATHTHTASQISDSTATGRSVLTAADAAAARTAIGAGTSNLALGTTASTAKAGNYSPPAATTTAQGIVELATTAETTTGTDTTRAVTPAGVKAVADTKANATHEHTASQVTGLATVATTGAYSDLTGTPTIPDSPGGIGAAPATHDHTAADIDSGAATDGHVLTADGAGGAAWEAPPAGGGGSIDGLNVVTGAWPPPLESWAYPEGTLYVRAQNEENGPVMAVMSSYDWRALAVGNKPLAQGSFDPNAFTPGIGEMDEGGWVVDRDRSEGWASLTVNEAPESGDILCTFDTGSMSEIERDCLEEALRMGEMLTAEGGNDGVEGVHHIVITDEGFIKYLWHVAGAPLAAGDFLYFKWPITLQSQHWG